MIESHIEHDLEIEQGSASQHKVGLGRKVKEQHESNRNNKENQDSDWKSMERATNQRRSLKKGMVESDEQA